MANRNDPDVSQHETLPGPGPGLRPSPSGSHGIRPVEQMVDAAIERIARENLSHEAPAVAADHQESEELDLAIYETSASKPRSSKPSRLRWKGLDVSDEFRSYAERVARGEDLPPFEGRVLAEPNEEFPWGRSANGELTKGVGRGSRILLWSSAAIVLALLGWSLVSRLQSRASIASGDTASSNIVSSASPIASGAAAPHDVVESTLPAREASDAVGVKEPTEPVAPSPAPDSVLTPANGATSVVHAAITVAPDAATSASSPATPAAPARAATAAATTRLAPQAAPPGHAGAVAAAGTGTAASNPVLPTPNDDFGILPTGDPAPAGGLAPTAAAPLPGAPLPGAPLLGAKTAPPIVGNVGDLSRVGAPSPGAVRKEPGSESSAKGSLLVETPSF